jgi:hypothetical protein
MSSKCTARSRKGAYGIRTRAAAVRGRFDRNWPICAIPQNPHEHTPRSWAGGQPRRVRAYALVTADVADEAVDVFLRRVDAEAALADVLHDEPESPDLPSVVELDERRRVAELAQARDGFCATASQRSDRTENQSPVPFVNVQLPASRPRTYHRAMK